MDISEMTSADFLEQPLAKGIVTSTLINNFKNHSKIKERKQQNSPDSLGRQLAIEFL